MGACVQKGVTHKFSMQKSQVADKVRGVSRGRDVLGLAGVYWAVE